MNLLFDQRRAVKRMVNTITSSPKNDVCFVLGINVTITETDRFETLSLYYDMGNLTIITTHNVRLHLLVSF
jgi:hypothetical protein